MHMRSNNHVNLEIILLYEFKVDMCSTHTTLSDFVHTHVCVLQHYILIILLLLMWSSFFLLCDLLFRTHMFMLHIHIYTIYMHHSYTNETGPDSHNSSHYIIYTTAHIHCVLLFTHISEANSCIITTKPGKIFNDSQSQFITQR